MGENYSITYSVRGSLTSQGVGSTLQSCCVRLNIYTGSTSYTGMVPPFPPYFIISRRRHDQRSQAREYPSWLYGTHRTLWLRSLQAEHVGNGEDKQCVPLGPYIWQGLTNKVDSHDSILWYSRVYRTWTLGESRVHKDGGLVDTRCPSVWDDGAQSSILSRNINRMPMMPVTDGAPAILWWERELDVPENPYGSPPFPSWHAAWCEECHDRAPAAEPFKETWSGRCRRDQATSILFETYRLAPVGTTYLLRNTWSDQEFITIRLLAKKIQPPFKPSVVRRDCYYSILMDFWSCDPL